MKLLLAPWNTTESVSNQRPPKALRPRKAQRPESGFKLNVRICKIDLRSFELNIRTSGFDIRISCLRVLKPASVFEIPSPQWTGFLHCPAVILGNTSIGAGKPNAEARCPHSNTEQRNTHTQVAWLPSLDDLCKQTRMFELIGLWCCSQT
jgi:hypothetical protein